MNQVNIGQIDTGKVFGIGELARGSPPPNRYMWLEDESDFLTFPMIPPCEVEQKVPHRNYLKFVRLSPSVIELENCYVLSTDLMTQAYELTYKEACTKEYQKKMFSGTQRVRKSAKALRLRARAVQADTAKRELIKQRNELARLSCQADEIPSVCMDDFAPLLESVREDLPAATLAYYDEWASHVENVAILGYQLGVATSLTQCFVAVVSYLKSYTQGRSLSFQIYELINKSVALEPQELNPHGLEASKILDTWELLNSNPMYKKIAFLISAAMSMTICSFKKIEWSPFGFELISLEAAKEQVKTFDVLDACIKTFSWMATTGYKVIEQRSFLPLVYSDQRIAEYNKICDEVLAYADIACAGNVEDLNDFEHKTDRALELTSDLKGKQPTGATAMWLQNKYAALVDIKQRLIAKRRNTTTRFAPIGWSIFGGTGLGKSSIASYVMHQSLHAMGFSIEPDRIMTLDQGDKYQSTYTSDINGMYIDDISNTKSQFVENAPTSLIIKFFNNVAAQAIKAEIQSKGVVFLDFKCGVITTNKRNLDAPIYSNCPEAILRRFYHITVEVKPEYRKKGTDMLDSQGKHVLNNTDPIPDFWFFSVSECVGNGGDSSFRPITFNFGQGDAICEGINVRQLMHVVRQLSIEHKIGQEAMLKRESVLKTLNFCNECKNPATFCSCMEHMNSGDTDVTLSDQAICGSDGTDQLNSNSSGECTLVQQTTKSARVVYFESPENSDSDDSAPSISSSDWHQLAELELRDFSSGGRHRGRTLHGFGRGGRVNRRSNLAPHGLEVFTDIAVNAMMRSFKSYCTNLISPFYSLHNLLGWKPLADMATKDLAREITSCYRDTFDTYLIACVPQWLENTRLYQRYVNGWYWASAYLDSRRLIVRGVSCLGSGLVAFNLRSYRICNYSVFPLFAIGTTSVVAGLLTFPYRLRRLKQQYFARRDVLSDKARAVRDNPVASMALLAVSLAAGVKIMELWNRKRIAALEPNSLTDPFIQDSKPGWFGAMMERFGVKTKVSQVSKTTSLSDIEACIIKNTFWADCTRKDGSQVGMNIFFPRKCVAFFPLHAFYRNSDMSKTPQHWVDISVLRSVNRNGGTFKFRADLSASYIMPEKDLVAIYVPNCPDLKDMSHFFPYTQPTGKGLARLIQRTKDGGVKKSSLSVRFEEVQHRYKSFYGCAYYTELARVGACMAPVVSDTRNNTTIYGFHIGGCDKTDLGVAQNVTRKELDIVYKSLESDKSIVLSAHATELPLVQYNKPILVSSAVHPNAKMLHDVDPTAVLEVFGSTKLRSETYSNVIPSILSEHVTDVMGIPNQWGPPQLRPNWKAFNATLEHIQHPSEPFLHTDLSRAREDYISVLRVKIAAYILREPISVLTPKEVVMGIPGKRFVDAIPMSTSMGFPVYGSKKHHFEEILAEDGSLLDRIPSKEIECEIERMMNCWRKGTRAYAVYSASLKDEPTVLGKDKVRVFQAVPIAFGMCVRKYFLPIARFMSLHPLESECAVGVNCMGPDWAELMDYAYKYSNEGKVLGWDYSKFDVRMNSQVTRCALSIFIELAELAGYSQDDLYIMKMMVSDLVHPLMDYNGTLLMAYNMNPSGNNITVNINSIVGALYVRLGFFHVYPHEKSFRDCVALMTYGDDATGSVKSEYEGFNFETFKKYIGRHDIKITLPDKSEVSKQFLHIDNVDFLKRQSNYIPEIDRVLGKLDENSIFKSLHSNVRSRTEDPRHVAISCMESALHEWFAYGKDHYNMRSNQLQEVARRANISCNIFYSFDERVTKWMSDYNTDDTTSN